jgi:GEVED domain
MKTSLFTLLLVTAALAANGQSRLDFGDAPLPYPTLRTNDGARHRVGSLYFGASIDHEPDGRPSSGADGDDLSGVDDEDGITFGAVSAGVATITVTVSGLGRLDAWADFDRDGVWEPSERIFHGTLVDAPARTLTFPVPTDLSSGTVYFRFRLSSTGGLTPKGLAATGEVEDYAATYTPYDTSGNGFFSLQGSSNPTASRTESTTVSTAGFAQAAVVESEDSPEIAPEARLAAVLASRLLAKSHSLAALQQAHRRNFDQLPAEARPLYLRAVALSIGMAAALDGTPPAAEDLTFVLTQVALKLVVPGNEPERAVADALLREINAPLADALASDPALAMAVREGVETGAALAAD